ncbi:MAG: ATP-grasp domain-containing protein [Streptomycetales bacterium]
MVEFSDGGGTAPPARRVAVLTEKRYLAHLQPAGLVTALRRQGHDVRVLVCDGVAVDLQPDVSSEWRGVDVAVARGRRAPLPTLLDHAEVCGVPVVDPASSIRGVVDKAAMSVRLMSAEIPTPTTVIGHPRAVARTHSLRFPVICKPVTGDNCEGLLLVRTARELAELRWPESIAVVQSFLPTDGTDLKLYGIGDAVFAVRRPAAFPARPGAADFDVLLPVSTELKELAASCARLFGLTVYGVDCVVSRGRTVVLEVNDFPTFRGVPGADDVLASHVLGRSRREVPLCA